MSGFDISYTYDPAGNRLTKTDNLTSEVTTYTYDVANRLLSETDSSGTTVYEHDADGNRTKKETPSTTTYYEWDEENHLIGAEPASGKVTLTYNGDGQRVKKETPSEIKNFIYDYKNLLQETNGNDETQHLYTQTIEEYGDLISEFGDDASSYFQYDALGSADALLDVDGSVTDQYQYTAFGLQSHTTGSSANPFTFVGRQNYYHDDELELYLLGMGNSDGGGRHYDPSVGAFLSEDPLGLAAGDANIRRYVGNHATISTDASGLAEGHHWVPVAVIMKLRDEGILSEIEAAYFGGRRSGPLRGGHTYYKPYKGIAHSDYSDAVETQLRNWKKSKTGGKYTKVEIADNIRDGYDWRRQKQLTVIDKFNRGVKKDILHSGPRPNRFDIDTEEQICKKGRTSLRSRGKAIAFLGAFAGALKTADAANQANRVADILAHGEGMKRATEAAQRGDLGGMRLALIVPGHRDPSVWEELDAVDRVFATAFRKAAEEGLDQLDEEARESFEKAIGGGEKNFLQLYWHYLTD